MKELRLRGITKGENILLIQKRNFRQMKLRR